MPELFGRSYSRSDLMRRVGRLEQVAGVRLVTLDDGLGRGVRLIEFRTGSGFSFDVVVDRSFDIGRCEIDGQPLNWQSNAGIVGPWYYENDEWGWFRAWGGGMVVTCGLDHTLVGGQDDAGDFHQPHMFKTVAYGLHGRIGGLPARLVGYGERWEGDECILWAEGEVLQSAVFGEHLLLRRTVEARVGESHFTIHDVVENVGHSRVSHMLLYHCNAGFPVVDDASELLVPSLATTSDYDISAEDMRAYRILSGPIQDFTEECYEHELVAETDGTVPAAVVNRRLKLGVYQTFRIDQMPYHTVWRMMGEDTYALAMEPSTNRDAGRWDAKKRGELLLLEPGELRPYDLTIGALVGSEAIDDFTARVGRVMPAAI
jgi:hypothetical protein